MRSIKDVVYDLEQTDFVLRNRIGLSNTETFGIEIEFENVNLDKIKGLSKWSLKKDDSVTIDNIGGEIISPILIDNEDTWKDIDSKCKYLKNKKAIVTEKTGSHIHIGSQILENNPDHIRKFLKLWEAFENIIYYFSYGEDVVSRYSVKKYSRPICNDLYKIRNSKKGYKQLKSYYDWYHFFKKQNFNKETGINFRNYKGYEMDENNTIEIRCPNGTLDSRIWQNNINFFTKLMKCVTKENFDEDLIDYYLSKKGYEEYGDDAINFVDFEKAIILSDIVFDDEMDKLLFLKQYFKLFEHGKTYIRK